MLGLVEKNGNAAFRRVLYMLEVEHFTSVRVDNPDAFTDLPPRFLLRRKASACWLTDTAAPKSYVGGR